MITTFGSIGIAQYPENGDSPDSLIKAADEAMYQVKATGKSGFSFSKNQAVKAIPVQEWSVKVGE